MNRRTLLTFAVGFACGSVASALALSSTVKPAASQAPAPAVSRPSAPPSVQAASSVSPAAAVSAAPAPAQPPATGPASVETPAFKALFAKDPDPLTDVYAVVSGDTLTGIAKKAGCTAGLLQRMNGLADDRLKIGQRLKTPKTAFTAVVDRSQNLLMLKAGEEVLKTYAVSTGAPGQETPLGVFKITDRLINPTWYKAGAVVPPDSAENVLGTRWLGFTIQGYGIHGTTEPDKIGQSVTAGCVRMRNAEAEELYDFLPAGAEVTIVD